MIIVDTNVLAYMFIEGEHTEAVRQVWLKDSAWRAPPLWRSEFLNVLVISRRAGVIDTTQVFEAWRLATSLMMGWEVEPRGNEVLRCAMEYGVSAYNAQFVVVAEQLKVPLVTGDRRLMAACPSAAISIDDYAAH